MSALGHKQTFVIRCLKWLARRADDFPMTSAKPAVRAHGVISYWSIAEASAKVIGRATTRGRRRLMTGPIAFALATAINEQPATPCDWSDTIVTVPAMVSTNKRDSQWIGCVTRPPAKCTPCAQARLGLSTNVQLRYAMPHVMKLNAATNAALAALNLKPD